MWNFIVKVILRNRIAILLGIFAITCFMGYRATKVQLSYEMARMLPTNDANSIKYQDFKKVFGEDGNVIFIGFEDSKLFTLSHFSELSKLCDSIRHIDGVEGVLSVTNVYTLQKNDSLHKFEVVPIISHLPSNQLALDSVKDKVFALKFYDNLLFNKKTNCYMIGITLTKNKLNDKSRIVVVSQISSLFTKYSAKFHIPIHYSGLPYIRTVITQMIQHELYLFITISLIIAALLIMLFFRSFYVVLTSMIIVVISVIWSMGIISLFGYKITILVGVLPSILIIIAIENCIYLVNKYHWEYKRHGNKILSLSRVASRMGFATLMTNATTATGFATFIFTSNAMLKEFGVVASINVMIEYILSLVLTIIIFSYLPEPTKKQLKHLDRKSTNFLVDGVKSLLSNHRKSIYIASIIIVVICMYGVTKMKISGRLVDDIPQENKIYKDLMFFETNAGGVMPFEISIDTKEKKGLFKDGAKVIYKIKQFQKKIKNDTAISKYFSRPVSIVEAVCFANQMYNNGNPKFYMVPPPMELSNLSRYVGSVQSNKNAFHSFIDSNMQVTRISIQMADIGTTEMNKVFTHVRPQLDSIFPPKDYTVVVTGSSVVFSKGTEFLIKNLWESIIIGIFLISILMAIIFYSFRMIVIAMIVNLIPLLITAAIMGYFSIPVKPSTIIVFSVALGISIDNAILFLTRYRHEIKKGKQSSITKSVLTAVDESALSMIYTSIVLVLGFAIYMLSGFGGTKALGFLISVTLAVALFFNLIVLPALLLSFEKLVTTHAFEEPLIDMYDDDENGDDREKELETI